MSGFELQEATYRAMFQYLPHAVLLLDDKQCIVLANRAASHVFRVPPEKLIGARIASVIPHRNLTALIRDFGDTSTKQIEVHLAPERADRPAVILKITVSRVTTWAGAARAHRVSATTGASREFRLLVVEDVTEKAILEEQLVQTEKLASMGQLAAGVAHELGNPLASMMSNLLYLRETLNNGVHAEAVDTLEAVLDRLEQMRQLLGTLSGFTRRQHPRYELADIHEVVRRTVTFIAKEAERRRIELAISLGPAVSMCEIDVRVVSQVLLNIFKNAMEAMPGGGRMEVRTRWRGREEGEAVIVEVADTGSGISEPDLRKVFRPLYSTKPRGTGLGLSFCRQAVEEHGGEIRITSRKGYGTTVTLVFPVRQEASVA